MVAPFAPLLRTKLHVPVPRPDSIQRPALLARLESARESGYRLLLLSAPAGYGKTTLASSWLANLRAQAGAAAAWLTLDAEENDPARFWSYFIAALQTALPEAGRDSLSLLRASPPAPIQSILALLINDLDSANTSLVMVLDDFHHILTPDIHAGLAYFLDHLPDGVALVLLTRADPFLPLARLHARRQVLELRLNDLRFNAEEQHEFFERTMRLDLTDRQITQLEQITEGWAAGLQMAGLSLKSAPDLERAIRSYDSRDRLLLDFFAGEILTTLPLDLQDFLGRTALLEPFCAELCDAVLEVEGSREMIAALERQNLFVTPLDGTRQWFRYHPLFAELLLQRMQSNLGAEAMRALHRRAAGWYAARQYHDQAIRHYLAAGAREEASRLVEIAAIPHLLFTEIVTVQNWLEAFGPDWLEHDPLTSVVQAWSLLAHLRLHEIEPVALRAERLIKAATGLAAEQIRDLQGQIAAIRATVAVNLRDLDAIETHALRALSLLSETNLILRSLLYLDLGDLYQTRGDYDPAQRYFEKAAATAQAVSTPLIAVNALANLGNQRLRMGYLRQAEHLYTQALQIAADCGTPRLPVTGTAEIGLARLSLARGDMQQARAHVDAALALFRLWNHPLQTILAHFCLVDILILAGDLDQAWAALRQAQDLILKHNLPFLALNAAVLEAGLCLAGEDGPSRLDKAEKTLKKAGAWIDPPPPGQDLERAGFLRFGTLQVCSRLLAMRGEIDPALTLLEAGMRMAESLGLRAEAGRLRFQRAVVLANRRKDEALSDLDAVLSLVEPEGFQSLFASEGRLGMHLLQVWLDCRPRQPRLVEFVRGVLVAFFPDDQKSILPVQPSGLDALSEREIEVLRLVAAGLSNDAIAAELIVSTNTIKTHLKRIYEKLYVNSRLEAVNQARARNIL